MGSVIAGDYILFLQGKIEADQIRERCGYHATLHCMRRQGDFGIYVRLACWLRDQFRKIEWRWQKRMYPVRYPRPIGPTMFD